MSEKKAVNKAVAIVGVSGSGKSTLANALTKLGGFKLVCSHTTRPMRPGEVHGEDYYFISKEEFDSITLDQQWVEHIHLYGNQYGLHATEMRKIMHDGLIPIIILDPNGFAQTAEHCRGSEIQLYSFYVDGDVETLTQRYLTRLNGTNLEYHANRLTQIPVEKTEWKKQYDAIVAQYKVEGGIVTGYNEHSQNKVHEAIIAAVCSPDRHDYYDLQKNVVDWANGVFKSRNEETIIRKLALEEAPELIIALSKGDMEKVRDELADVTILLMDLSHRLGIDILREAHSKMIVNRQRKWTINQLGISSHVQ